MNRVGDRNKKPGRKGKTRVKDKQDQGTHKVKDRGREPITSNGLNEDQEIPGDMQILTKALNEGQSKAVKASPGPILVIAGPGTGKTRTLAYRTAYLINNTGVKPEEIKHTVIKSDNKTVVLPAIVSS